MMNIKIGTRESRLAVIQAELLAEYIQKTCPGMEPKLVTMKTTGDKILNKTLDKIGGKGLFVKELDLALLEGRSDVSVHSLKDVPMEVPEELPLLGFSKREDVRDVLVLPKDTTILNPDLPLGCSSARRTIQLKKLFPEMEVKSVRGNVLTRLEKLDRGEYSGLVLAAAGLKRLGLEERISRYFTTEEMLPAAGQGILAVQGRKGEDYDYLKGFFDENSTLCALAERSFVRTLDGGCSSPIAAYAVIEKVGHVPAEENDRKVKEGVIEEKEVITLTGLYAEEGSAEYQTGVITGTKEQAKQLGEMLAERMKNADRTAEKC